MASLETTSNAARLPFSTSANYFLRSWGFKAVVRLFIWYLKLTKKRVAPNVPYTKTYTQRPEVAARIFIPSSYKSGDAPLPLLIDIHGGGFAIGAPIFDDEDNVILSQQHGFCVVSIGYRLAPAHPFPTAAYDVATTIRAVLDDKSLPVDKSKVAVCGYSAGGNLSLAATQLDGLNKDVKAVVSYYPTTNFNLPREEKLKLATPPPNRVDTLKELSKLFNWAYVKPGQNKRDPLLSPHFADRKALPEKLYLIGCEYDMLCPESNQTAEKMAEAEHGEKLLDEDGQGWSKGNVRWRMIKHAEHGFNQFSGIYHGKGEGSKQEIRERAIKKMHADVAQWLKDEVFA